MRWPRHVTCVVETKSGGGESNQNFKFGISVSLEEAGWDCGEPWRRMLWRCEPSENHRHLLFYAKKVICSLIILQAQYVKSTAVPVCLDSWLDMEHKRRSFTELLSVLTVAKPFL